MALQGDAEAWGVLASGSGLGEPLMAASAVEKEVKSAASCLDCTSPLMSS